MGEAHSHRFGRSPGLPRQCESRSCNILRSVEMMHGSMAMAETTRIHVREIAFSTAAQLPELFSREVAGITFTRGQCEGGHSWEGQKLTQDPMYKQGNHCTPRHCTRGKRRHILCQGFSGQLLKTGFPNQNPSVETSWNLHKPKHSRI